MKRIIALTALMLVYTGAFPQENRKDVVYFDTNKSMLNHSSVDVLNLLIDNLLQSKEYRVEIHGHTDTIGNDSFNLQLAEQRAKAVQSYLIDRGLNDSNLVVLSFGRQKPAFPNAGENTRKWNRRVEIVSSYTPKQAEEEDNITEPVVVPRFENDTTIRGKHGTELVITQGTFFPHRIGEIDFEINETLTLGDIFKNHLQTRDSRGNCLSSGGMVFVTATVNGNPIQPNRDSTILYRIPSQNLDGEMRLYKSDDPGLEGGWGENETPLTINNQENFYEFRIDTISNFNIDKPAPYIPILSLRLNLSNENGVVVKSRMAPYSMTYSVSRAIVMVVEGDIFKEKKVRFPLCALRSDSNFIAVFEKKGKFFIVNKPFSDLNYSRLFRRFFLKRSDYTMMSWNDIQSELDNL
jgi:hypothetical protein